MALRVVFFGNSESAFSNRHFDALCRAGCVISAVVDVPASKRTSTNTRLLASPDFVERARSAGLPRFEPADPNLPEFIDTLREPRPDLFLAVGYTGRLKSDLLSVPRLLAANFHASLLPSYRGKHPLFWALRNGERWVGLTVHVMDAGLDTGDILYQVRLRTRQDDSVAGLYDRVMDRSVDLVRRLITDAAAGTLRRTPQGTAGASYYSTVTPEDFRLDWSRPAALLHRWVCASPGQCFCAAGGRRIRVLTATALRNGPSARPGTVVRVSRTSVSVAAGGGVLRLREVDAGAGAQPAGAWARAAGVAAGMQME